MAIPWFTRVAVASAIAAAAWISGAAGTWADPPGNNGTVKVDGVVFDDAPDNQPHVGCTFQIDFYGFDAGNLNAAVSFAVHPPTGNDIVIKTDTVPIGEDAAGGGTDLDAQRTYNLATALAGFTPQPNQGFHIKLTVHADGAQGNDTKYKVFWVNGCGSSSPS